MKNFKFICAFITIIFLIDCTSSNNNGPKYILDKKVTSKKLNISFSLPDGFEHTTLRGYLVKLEEFSSDSINIDFNTVYQNLHKLTITNNKAVELSVYCYFKEDPRNVIAFQIDKGFELNKETAYAITYLLDEKADDLNADMDAKRFYGKLKNTNKFPYLALKYNVTDTIINSNYTFELYYIQRRVNGLTILAYTITDETDLIEEIVRSINVF